MQLMSCYYDAIYPWDVEDTLQINLFGFQIVEKRKVFKFQTLWLE